MCPLFSRVSSFLGHSCASTAEAHERMARHYSLPIGRPALGLLLCGLSSQLILFTFFPARFFDFSRGFPVWSGPWMILVDRRINA